MICILLIRINCREFSTFEKLEKIQSKSIAMKLNKVKLYHSIIESEWFFIDKLEIKTDSKYLNYIYIIHKNEWARIFYFSETSKK